MLDWYCTLQPCSRLVQYAHMYALDLSCTMYATSMLELETCSDPYATTML